MKRLTVLCLCFVICLTVVACKSTKSEFVFEDLRIAVKMYVDDTVKVAYDDHAMLVTDAQSGDSLGVISVSRVENKNIDEIYNAYISVGKSDVVRTEISDKLIFLDVSNNVYSEVLGNSLDKVYCFIFYDKNTSAVLYGRFFESNDRNNIINLAKSIETVDFNA